MKGREARKIQEVDDIYETQKDPKSYKTKKVLPSETLPTSLAAKLFTKHATAPGANFYKLSPMLGWAFLDVSAFESYMLLQIILRNSLVY